jgi:chromosome segregation ATPase
MNPSLINARHSVTSAVARYQDSLGSLICQIEAADDHIQDLVNELDRIGCPESTHGESFVELNDAVGEKRQLCDQAWELQEKFLDHLSDLRDHIDTVMENVYESEIPTDDLDMSVSKYID